MSLRDLNQISIERDSSETSQKHLKRNVFFVTSLRRLKNISKKMSFAWRSYDVSGISQKRCLFRDVSETSLKHLSQVFLVFQKYNTKMISCDFRRLITISDKIEVGSPETLKKWNVSWERCIDVNQSSVPSGLISTWEFWQVKNRQNPIVKCIIDYFQWFFSTDKIIYNLLSL